MAKALPVQLGETLGKAVYHGLLSMGGEAPPVEEVREEAQLRLEQFVTRLDNDEYRERVLDAAADYARKSEQPTGRRGRPRKDAVAV